MSTQFDLPSQFVDQLLLEQQTLTAVEQFALHHEGNGSSHYGEPIYRDLIPAGPPGQGEQYAFEVDLDACSGCKACVVACHNMNGLEKRETWREVGQLVGGGVQPFTQHITTACHHCLEPACLQGCPVNAYEKDEETGIVRHLDDQCIGCQYCILKCPYEVPVYSKSKGIVRKCDMCHQRLAIGEAPACVQSCPNQAIRIRSVAIETVRDECEVDHFLPGAPDPIITLPTTAYRTQKVMPRNALPADYFAVARSAAHLPLVLMLVLTQMSVGAFVVEQFLYSYGTSAGGALSQEVRFWHLCAALLLGFLGLGASLFHLGRPHLAFRALLGLRTSWLSREILAFNLFAASSTVYVVASCLSGLGYFSLGIYEHVLGGLAAFTGVVAVICSAMIYVDTRRPLWTFGSTTPKFLLTAGILGSPTALLVSLVTATISIELTFNQVMSTYGFDLCRIVLGLSLGKLIWEASLVANLKDRKLTPRRRSAMLTFGELGVISVRRFLLGTLGGVVLPVILLMESALSPNGFPPAFIGIAVILMLGLLTAGELHERYLFFTASVAPRMPGLPAL